MADDSAREGGEVQGLPGRAVSAQGQWEDVAPGRGGQGHSTQAAREERGRQGEQGD